MIGAPLWETYGNLQFPIVAPDLVQCATSRGMLEFLRTATGLQGCKAARRKWWKVCHLSM
jgi:hypothetical protein